MDLAAHRSHDGVGVVLLDDPADGPGGGTVAVTPTTASTSSRGLRIQGMPVRRWLRTTPGRLRAASALLVVGLLVFAIATTSATQARSKAAGKVATESTPALLAAQSLYSSLADADAIASTVFLRAGLEPSELREPVRPRPRGRRPSPGDPLRGRRGVTELAACDPDDLREPARIQRDGSSRAGRTTCRATRWATRTCRRPRT